MTMHKADVSSAIFLVGFILHAIGIYGSLGLECALTIVGIEAMAMGLIGVVRNAR